MRITADKSESKTFTHEPLPEGRYAVRIDKYETLAGKKNPDVKYIKWTVVVAGDSRFTNRLIWLNTVYAGGPSWFFWQFVRAANPDMEYNSDGVGEVELDDLLDKVLEVEIRYDMDKITGKPSIYPTVSKCTPYVSDISDFANFSS